MLGLTATATYETAITVASYFNIDPENGIIRGDSIVPSNLRITAASSESNKYEVCDLHGVIYDPVMIIQQLSYCCCQALVNLLNSPKFVNLGSVIVYCNRQYLTENTAEKLSKDLQPLKLVGGSSKTEKQGNDPLSSKSTSKRRQSTNLHTISKQRRVERNVGYYHGDMKPDERDSVHKNFMEGKMHVVVATEAFGVGLDKKDVRAIIHYDIPKSIELYIQEVGRAGRDDKAAYCHAFVDDEVSMHTHQ